MKERVEATIKHIRENFMIYLYVTTVAGFTVVIMRGRHAGIRGVPDGPDMVTVRPFSFFSKQTIVTVLEREGRGHPGYIVRCKETNDIFLSQREAAKAFNLHPSLLSGHLNGKFKEIDGYHFERLCV